jgi:5-methylcytosine-specific restriction endonuclease McrA
MIEEIREKSRLVVKEFQSQKSNGYQVVRNEMEQLIVEFAYFENRVSSELDDVCQKMYEHDDDKLRDSVFRTEGLFDDGLKNFRRKFATLSRKTLAALHAEGNLNEYIQDLDFSLTVLDEKIQRIGLVDSKSDPQIREQVWAKTNGTCVYCDCSIDHPNEIGAQVMHVDHFVPVACGGPDNIANYVPACQKCNISKKDRDPVAFVLKLRGPNLTVVEAAE